MAMKGAAWRVGLMTLVGLGLLALAVILAGGHYFVAREKAQMRFQTSVYGLQVGAAVVFRGVRVGQVSSVGLAPAGPDGVVAVPVTAEFERAQLRGLLGPGGSSRGGNDAVLPALIDRGLVARLATQSLLTGQLYVDLDLEAARAAKPVPAGASEAATAPIAPGASAAESLPLIPTARTQLQSLQAQLDGLDLAQVGRDLSALTASMRQLLAGPEPTRLITRAADAAQALERLVARIDREVGPLSRSAQSAFGEGQRAANQVGQGAQLLGQSASQLATQLGAAASQAQASVGALSGAGTVTLAQVQRSAEAVQQAADALRGLAADDSGLRVHGERALQDVSKAARAMRELADLLEQHPEALLRGRAAAP